MPVSLWAARNGEQRPNFLIPTVRSPGSLFDQCGSCDQKLALELHTDDYGSETSWILVPGARVTGCEVNETYSGSLYPNFNGGVTSVELITAKICAHQEYIFTLFDSNHDGFCCQYGKGSYTLSLSGAIVGSSANRTFQGNLSSSFVAPLAPTPLPTSLPSSSPSVYPTDMPSSSSRCGACDQTARLTIMTDNYGQEITWRFKSGTLQDDCASTVDIKGGPYSRYDGGKIYVEEITRQVCAYQDYELTIYDSAGDGLCCGSYGNGSYSLYITPSNRNTLFIVADKATFRSSNISEYFVAPYVTHLPTFSPTHLLTKPKSESPSSTPSLAPTLMQSTEPSLACGSCDQTVTLNLHTDNYGSETSWVFKSAQHAYGCSWVETVWSPPYRNHEGGEIFTSILSTTACAREDYIFTIFDSPRNSELSPDGLCCSHGRGNFSISLNGVMLATRTFKGASTTLRFHVDSIPTLSPTRFPTQRPTVDSNLQPSLHPTFEGSIPISSAPSYFSSPTPSQPTSEFLDSIPTPLPSGLPSQLPTLIPSLFFSFSSHSPTAASVKTIPPSLSPTTFDTIRIRTTLVLVTSLNETFSMEQEISVLTPISKFLNLSLKSIENFNADIKLDRRRSLSNRSGNLRHRVLSSTPTLRVTFDVVISLSAARLDSASEFASSIESALVDPMFLSSVSEQLGLIVVVLDIFTAIIHRPPSVSFTAAPIANPTRGPFQINVIEGTIPNQPSESDTASTNFAVVCAVSVAFVAMCLITVTGAVPRQRCVQKCHEHPRCSTFVRAGYFRRFLPQDKKRRYSQSRIETVHEARTLRFSTMRKSLSVLSPNTSKKNKILLPSTRRPTPQQWDAARAARSCRNNELIPVTSSACDGITTSDIAYGEDQVVALIKATDDARTSPIVKGDAQAYMSFDNSSSDSLSRGSSTKGNTDCNIDQDGISPPVLFDGKFGLSLFGFDTTDGEPADSITKPIDVAFSGARQLLGINSGASQRHVPSKAVLSQNRDSNVEPRRSGDVSMSENDQQLQENSSGHYSQIARFFPLTFGSNTPDGALDSTYTGENSSNSENYETFSDASDLEAVLRPTEDQRRFSVPSFLRLQRGISNTVRGIDFEPWFQHSPDNRAASIQSPTDFFTIDLSSSDDESNDFDKRRTGTVNLARNFFRFGSHNNQSSES